MGRNLRILVLLMVIEQVVMLQLPWYGNQQHCAELLKQYDPNLLDYFKFEMSQGFERFFLLSYCLACCWPGTATNGLRVVRQWSELEFVFPSEEAERIAIEKRYYVRGNSVPIDVEVHHREGVLPSRIFVTNPRFDEGRPITLGTVDSQGKINGYPNYEWNDNQGTNCDGLTSVFRVAIDECKRLWVMDSGKIGNKQSCAPQLLAFDLNTDQVIYRHRLAASLVSDNSLFINPVVDVRPRGPGDCADTFVYIADVTGFAVIVVDVLRDRSWQTTHRLYYPFPSRATITIDGESFDLVDGVMGMALSPYAGGDRHLYFHALASTTENVLNTRVIRNASLMTDASINPRDAYVFPEERPSQSAAEAIDSNGIMYFGLMDPPSILCWNTATDYNPSNFHTVAINRETLQFAGGVKIVNNAKGEQELWVMTSSFQRVMTGTLSSDRVNFRIHAEKISTLLENSPCLNHPKGRKPGHHANLVVQDGESHPHITYRYGAKSFL